MKIAVITDTHFGARNDSQIFSDFMRDFYSNQFFPYLKENNITKCFHLGDVFDRRKYVNYKSLFDCREYFFEPLAKNNIEVLMLAGNHDTFYKTTNEINSITLLLQQYSNITTFDKPTELDSYVMLPWVCKDNHDISMKMVAETKKSLLFSHLEIAGFEAHAGFIKDEGFDKKMFNRFDMVMSGHYHHKSDNGTIYYLGNPYELTWQDYKDVKGFHTFDFETRELQFIPNTDIMFHKFIYNDTDLEIHQIDELGFNHLKNKYLKVIVQEKSNPYLFDMVMDKIYKVGPFDVTVVEHFVDMIDDEDIIDEAQDTVTILSNYIEQLNTNVNKTNLDGLIKNLYNEALTVE